MLSSDVADKKPSKDGRQMLNFLVAQKAGFSMDFRLKDEIYIAVYLQIKLCQYVNVLEKVIRIKIWMSSALS